jgi:hypothetical protein
MTRVTGDYLNAWLNVSWPGSVKLIYKGNCLPDNEAGQIAVNTTGSVTELTMS